MKYPLASVSWDRKEYQAALKVLSSEQFTMGSNVRHFEEVFAAWTGTRFAVFCNSGSSANLLALAAERYDPRRAHDEKRKKIIVPAVSWSTTYTPVIQLGYELVFVDCCLDSFNIDVQAIKSLVDEDTVGIFAVNLLGNPCKYQEILSICEEHDLFLLEDNCESMGAELGGRKTGAFGHISTHSTFFSHHIATMEGGVCTTDDPLTYEILKSLRAHGWTRDVSDEKLFYSYFDKADNAFLDRFHFVLPGFNFRPTEMSAAIGLEQMHKIDVFLQERRRNALHLRQRMAEESHLKFRLQKEEGESSWFGFGFIFETPQLRSEAVNRLISTGVEVRPIVSGNMCRQPLFNAISTPLLPNADTIHDCGLMLGNHQFDIRDKIDLAFDVLSDL